MTLISGSKLGPYEIVGQLGAGGMGEVYRARDTKLQRDVALKILPSAMAHDAQRMARFEREARTLASLNHPNIASIYGLEESNGVRALVMELVEGETLAERISVAAVSPPPVRFTKSKAAGEVRFKPSDSKTGDTGATAGAGLAPARGRGSPLQESLAIGKQIAEALEYAHERGVIHRDLKPANVKITPEGTVKVLDFGLAKVLDAHDSTATMDVANSPTLSAMATQAGMILGTAAYMSPEQAKGQRIDRRADIWAFGCVLFEMLAGRKPFEGETISDVLAAVIRAEPEWNAIPETTPPSIHRLIRRCLVKDPKQRLRDIGEARITIEEEMSGTGVPPVIEHGQDAHATNGDSRRTRDKLRSPLQRALPWALAAVGFLLAILLAAIYFFTSPAAPMTTRSQILLPRSFFSYEFAPVYGLPLLSPDGSRLVFPATDTSGKETLWVRPIDSLTAQRLEGTEGATFPFWAPDNRQVGFFQEGKLKTIAVAGGPPALLCDAPNGRGGAWSSNGVIVFAPEHNGGLSSVPAAGGTPTPIAAPKVAGGAFSNRWPLFLPDGKHFLYLSGNLESPGTSELGIRIGEIGSNEQKFLLQADSEILYSPPGYLLFLRGDTLMAQRFDPGGLKLKGEVFPVAEHVASPRNFRLGLFSVSQTGLLVYASSQGESGGQLVWMIASGKEIAKVGQSGVTGLSLSPDGKRLAYVAFSSQTNRDIWLMDLARGIESRLTFGPVDNLNPVWSPDGSKIAYTSVQNGFNLFVRNASGAGNAEPLLLSGAQKYANDWSRDGRYLLFTRLDPEGKTSADIWVLPMFGDHKPFPYIQTKFNEQSGVFSPDGRWVAYVSDESGSSEVFLSTFPFGGGKWQVSQGGGDQPEWKHDGSALYFIAPGGKLMEASVKENGKAVEIGSPHQLFQVSATESIIDYSVPPDEKRFLVDAIEQGASPPLTLVTNWTAMRKEQ